MRNKVVLVPFPFDDLSSNKVRPAVCLTEPLGSHRHVVVAFITSQVPVEMLDTDQLVEPSEPGFEATGLRTASVIRLHRLMTLSASIIQRELGVLPQALQQAVHDKLKKLFALG